MYKPPADSVYKAREFLACFYVFIAVGNWLLFSYYGKVNTEGWARWNHDIVSEFAALSGK